MRLETEFTRRSGTTNDVSVDSAITETAAAVRAQQEVIGAMPASTAEFTRHSGTTNDVSVDSAITETAATVRAQLEVIGAMHASTAEPLLYKWRSVLNNSAVHKAETGAKRDNINHCTTPHKHECTHIRPDVDCVCGVCCVRARCGVC